MICNTLRLTFFHLFLLWLARWMQLSIGSLHLSLQIARLEKSIPRQQDKTKPSTCRSKYIYSTDLFFVGMSLNKTTWYQWFLSIYQTMYIKKFKLVYFSALIFFHHTVISVTSCVRTVLIAWKKRLGVKHPYFQVR